VSIAEYGKLLAQLTSVLVALDDGSPLTWRSGEAARRILGADGAAITFDYTTNRRITVCVTNHVAERLEDLQDVLGEGPACEAFTTHQEVIASLDGAAERWPSFAAAALEAVGPLDLHAIPMQPSNKLLGVLTVYFSEGKQPPEGPNGRQFLANAVGAALLLDPAAKSPVESVGLSSWASRAPINQAVGMVISQLGVSPNDALALLRAHAFARNVDLPTIARETIDRRIDFSNFQVSGD